MYVNPDVALTRILYATYNHQEWALTDPDIPVLPALKPRIINLLEYLAYQFLDLPGADDLVNHNNQQEIGMMDLEGIFHALISVQDLSKLSGDEFPFDEGINRLRWALEQGLFEDPHSWTKSLNELAVSMTLQVVRRAMELKTGRRSVVRRFDQRSEKS